MGEAIAAIPMRTESNKNISTIVAGTGKKLMAFIRNRVNSLEDAEDILQDIFYQLSVVAQPVENATAWLYRVARNRITDNYRKQKLPLIEDMAGDTEEDAEWHWEELLPVEDTPESEYMRSVFWETFYSALGELPAEQREAFVFNELEGIPFKVLADKTGESVATLISRKRYAVLHLRKRMELLRNEMLNK